MVPGCGARPVLHESSICDDDAARGMSRLYLCALGGGLAVSERRSSALTTGLTRPTEHDYHNDPQQRDNGAVCCNVELVPRD